jgi:hypothetical protein
MKKILFILLLFVNLQCVINQDGAIELRSFTTAEAQHMNTEAQSYMCEKCFNVYGSYGRLQYHHVHEDEECYRIVCKYQCGRKFTSETKANEHYPYCPNREQCQYCRAYFSSKEEKDTHEKSCPYKSNDGSDTGSGTTIPVGYHSVFEYLPKDKWGSNNLSCTLSSLAYIEYTQPRYKHTAAEISTFKSKCENFRFSIEVDLRTALGNSPKIYINGHRYYVGYVDDPFNWTACPGLPIIFFDLSGSSLNVNTCVIGCNDSGDYLTLMNGFPMGYCFEISPAFLMSLVESNGKWNL